MLPLEPGLGADIIIGVDLMGGDHSPHAPLEGVRLFLKEYGDTLQGRVRFNLFGTPEVERRVPVAIRKHVKFFPCTQVVDGETKPAMAVRHYSDSSMWRAVNSVKTGESHCCISSGNTGALMAISKLALRTITDIKRPAICTFVPSQKGTGTVFLDLGANVTADAQMLFEFAIMGSAFKRNVYDVKSIKVGILNIGKECIKGTDTIQEAAELIRKHFSEGEFVGFVEPPDILSGAVDVVVTDGFTGNIALKSMESAAGVMSGLLRNAMREASLIEKVMAYPLLSMRFKKAAQRIDPAAHNGGLFTGLNGIVVKSHGSADGPSFKSAVRVAYNLTCRDFVQRLRESLQRQLSSDSAANIDNDSEPSQKK